MFLQTLLSESNYHNLALGLNTLLGDYTTTSHRRCTYLTMLYTLGMYITNRMDIIDRSETSRS